MVEKLIFGVDCVGQDLLIGPITTTIVGVKLDFFRNFAYLPFNKDPLKFDMVTINKIFDYTKRYVSDVHVREITANTINLNPEKSDEFIAKSYIETLNCIKHFWEHNVNVHAEPTWFLENFNSLMPVQLRTAKFDINKWAITEAYNRILVLARVYTLHHQTTLEWVIKSTWGDYGTGLASDEKTKQFIEANPKCPYIRKAVK